jgi:hypothetical protein
MMPRYVRTKEGPNFDKWVHQFHLSPYEFECGEVLFNFDASRDSCRNHPSHIMKGASNFEWKVPAFWTIGTLAAKHIT